ncbi:hypothetical protein Achl_4058 (plasmid) [Pseudarthrobacter chlorophenolicus A6]|uniref:Uncharacterized protein n=1 Tax=Pseudarthrobacter chlorophenolicus (strain ATCC 700700 / DSM 12829 / CIP 107037 / JCM 12360 / KCTC 9906 / NCIMB 13794 / A6) TaxID=452863 RepID=B8HHW2_PSECP|nr:hypothetical protein [Pseudarthrobacter chlorophenolicus]ACL42009.1 hypothetical protein Achl_4058 [Pseudarthrobacter chlorophenolicus A6]SDQ20253.1 hypothetical protein SAMN04489738_0709 [Pseudarthrobacter chlorophenolicus]
MSEYGHPEATIPPPAFPIPASLPAAPSQLPAQTSKAKSVLRISAGVTSIAVGFWGGSAALALHSMSTLLGPRFAWLGFLLGFAALCSVVTGFIEIVRHHLKDLRVPSLSIAFAAVNVLGYVAVFVAFPIATPMLGGLVASALGIVLVSLTMIFDAWPATAP